MPIRRAPRRTAAHCRVRRMEATRRGGPSGAEHADDDGYGHQEQEQVEALWGEVVLIDPVGGHEQAEGGPAGTRGAEAGVGDGLEGDQVGQVQHERAPAEEPQGAHPHGAGGHAGGREHGRPRHPHVEPRQRVPGTSQILAEAGHAVGGREPGHGLDGREGAVEHQGECRQADHHGGPARDGTSELPHDGARGQQQAQPPQERQLGEEAECRGPVGMDRPEGQPPRGDSGHGEHVRGGRVAHSRRRRVSPGTHGLRRRLRRLPQFQLPRRLCAQSPTASPRWVAAVVTEHEPTRTLPDVST